ncbi:MAG: DHHA1 domain-containing protein [Anaerolineae bacterium]
MTTQRLYYTDPYTTEFTAQALEIDRADGAPAAVLDRTCFYPTSGGQPHDIGTLNGVPVRDVIVRQSDGAVLHVLEREIAPGPVIGRIDWARRFDHMQQHTGQHVLSAAFERLADADTVGFHMSPDSITIDLNRPALSQDTLDAVEDLANQVVFENRPVRAWFPSDEERQALNLRKVPDVEGKFRVVAVADFDLCACGGTHVRHTGEIGLIKIVRTERRGDVLRVEFRCGGRALRDYRAKNALLLQLSASLTTGMADLPAVIAKLREENKALQRDLRALQALALAHEADRLRLAGERLGSFTLVEAAFDGRDLAQVRQLVQHLVGQPGIVALCAVAGDKGQFIAACSDDVALDMVAVLKRGLAVWGVERGGGRPTFAQGGGTAITLAEAQAALQAAAQGVRQMVRQG